MLMTKNNNKNTKRDFFRCSKILICGKLDAKFLEKCRFKMFKILKEISRRQGNRGVYQYRGLNNSFKAQEWATPSSNQELSQHFQTKNNQLDIQET